VAFEAELVLQGPDDRLDPLPPPVREGPLRLSVTDQVRRVAAPARKVGWVAIELVFETHSTTVDNEQGHATGWLSERGRAQAQQLGRRRLGDVITAVFSSDLARAAQTASAAFAGSAIPVL